MIDKKPETIRVELVCVGAFETVKDTIAYEFRRINPDGTMHPECMSWKKLYGTPGCVYSVETSSLEEFTEKGRCFPTTLRFEREWPDRSQATEWAHRSRAAETEHRAAKQRAKGEAEADEFRRSIAPLRRLYQRTNAQGKAAMLANIVLELNRRGDLED